MSNYSGLLAAHADLMSPGHHTHMRNVTDSVTFEEVKCKSHMQSYEHVKTQTGRSKAFHFVYVAAF